MKITEIFYSIQGEGYHTGTPAIFVRFAGCNLRCPFCDTDHAANMELTEEEVIEQVGQYPATWVILTGGEPTLQINEKFLWKLHNAGKKIAIETNGTNAIPANIDWITCSPKEAYVGQRGEPVLERANELKLVFTQASEIKDYGIIAQHYYLQPCDTGDPIKNKRIINNLVKYVKENPKWKISLQTQKMLNVR